jgi:yecA family protein
MTANAAWNLETNPSAAEIVAALEAAHARPDDALRAGVGRADEIAPAVIAILDEAASGTTLLESQANLLFWGIHVLGAAHRSELYRPLMRFLRACEDVDLDRLLGEATTKTLAPIVISVFDGDPLPLLDACSDRGVDEFARWNLIGALARLTFDGAVPRETTLAFLDRFDREALADPEDYAWQGWQDAICLLGLEEMRERLSAACREGRFHQSDAELDECLKQLTLARNLAPGDDALFIQGELFPLEDPVEALAWMPDDDSDEGDEGDDVWDDDFDVPDPASEFALSEEEVESLRQFIASRPAAVDVMTLEAIDGYYSALSMDPNWSRAREAAALIFGSSDQSLYFDSAEQEERITGLLSRHLQTIATRLDGSYRHVPLLEESGAPTGRVWAVGFNAGMQVAAAEWQDYIGNEEVSEFIVPVMGLAIDDHEEHDGIRMTPELRADLVPLMSVNLLGLYAAVRLEEEARKRRPARSTKVGRNEPCPCGSGKKYKRCCGSSDRQVS